MLVLFLLLPLVTNAQQLCAAKTCAPLGTNSNLTRVIKFPMTIDTPCYVSFRSVNKYTNELILNFSVTTKEDDHSTTITPTFLYRSDSGSEITETEGCPMDLGIFEILFGDTSVGNSVKNTFEKCHLNYDLHFPTHLQDRVRQMFAFPPFTSVTGLDVDGPVLLRTCSEVELCSCEIPTVALQKENGTVLALVYSLDPITLQWSINDRNVTALNIDSSDTRTLSRVKVPTNVTSIVAVTVVNTVSGSVAKERLEYLVKDQEAESDGSAKEKSKKVGLFALFVIIMLGFVALVIWACVVLDRKAKNKYGDGTTTSQAGVLEEEME